jgi:hypothetical protein
MRNKSLVAGYQCWCAAGGKPGPRRWVVGSGHRKTERQALVATPEERRQAAQAALAAFERKQAMAEREWWDNELVRSVIPGVLEYNRERAAAAAAEAARKPRLVVSHEPVHEPEPAREGASTQLVLVHDADALAKDIAAIGRLATARIKETLSKPFDPADPSYQALLRFTSGVYNTTLGAMLKADENLLRARAVDRLPELLERIAEEEKKRHDRQLDLDANPDDVA